jgi:hypothetical protein
MAFSKKTVLRIDDLSGDSFILMEAPAASTEYAQGVVLIDESGNAQGLASSPLIVTTNVGTVVNFYSGASNVASLAVQASSGVLRQLRVVLDPSVSVARYLLLFNSNDTLGNLEGTATGLIWQMVIPPAGEASESFPDGLAYSTGLQAIISTTHEVLTIVTSNEGIIFGQRV